MTKVLVAILGGAFIVFSILSYKQNQVISVLNDEIVSQAESRQRIMLDRYKLKLELDSLKASCAAQPTALQSTNEPKN